MSIGEWQRENGELWARRFATLLIVVTSPFPILHSPLPVLAQAAHSEIPRPISERLVEPRFTNLSLAQGLTQSSVYDILQDRNGFMWFATENAVNRYDGYEFKAYENIPFDSTSVSSGFLMDMEEDSHGRLWIASWDGLNVLDPITGKVRHYRHSPANDNSIAADQLNHILVDREGRVWITFLRPLGVDRFDPETGTATHFRSDADDPSSLSHDATTGLFEDSEGRIWVSTLNGLNRLNGNGSAKFEHFAMISGIDQSTSIVNTSGTFGPYYDAVYERPEEPGVLWVSSDSLTRLDVATGRVARYSFDSPGQRQYEDAIVQDPVNRNVLWISRQGSGLSRFDLKTHRFADYTANPGNPTSLSSDLLLSLLVDRSGIIWVGTVPRGVDRFDPASTNLGHLRHDPYDKRSLPGPNVWGISQQIDGTLWVATQDNKDVHWLTRIDPDGHSTHYKAGAPTGHGLVGAYITLFTDSRGTLWKGGVFGAFQRFDPAADQFVTQRHPTPEGFPEGDADRVRAIFEDRSGLFWVGTHTGLSRFDRATGQFTDYLIDRNDLNGIHGPVLGIAEDQAGSLWLATADGLNRFDPVTERLERIESEPGNLNTIGTNRLNRILASQSEPGVIWLVGEGMGLDRLTVATRGVEHYTSKDGLASNAIYGLLEDDQGDLWLSGTQGLSRFDPRTETFRNYGLEVGLQSLEFDGGSAHKGPRGELFFGGIDGLNVFFPNQLTENTTPPQVALVDLKLNNRSVTSDEKIQLESTISDLKDLTIDYADNEVTFDFVAIHFENPEKNQFAYKLEGFNDDWVMAGQKRTATYTNLSPGNYTFRVKAANSDGYWNQEGASIHLTVLPPWWRTWWAFALYALVFATGVFGVDRFQRRRLLQKEQQRAREKELEQAREIERAYNELRDTQDRLVQSEKMASLGQLTAGIAHEIKNPLNFVNNFSDVTAELSDELTAEIEKLKADLPAERLSEIEAILGSLSTNAKKIREHGKRADGIVQNMLEHSKAGEGQRASIDVNALLDDYATLALHGFKAQNPDFEINVEREFDASVGKIQAVPQELGRVLMNLIGNAFDALKEKGEGEKAKGQGPMVRVSTAKVGPNVEIRIADNGPGIPDKVKVKIFEPFFTTKPTGSGTGLGLSMSYDIVTKGHGGTLEVESSEGEGATFIVRLPV